MGRGREGGVRGGPRELQLGVLGTQPQGSCSPFFTESVGNGPDLRGRGEDGRHMRVGPSE